LRLSDDNRRTRRAFSGSHSKEFARCISGSNHLPKRKKKPDEHGCASGLSLEHCGYKIPLALYLQWDEIVILTQEGSLATHNVDRIAPRTWRVGQTKLVSISDDRMHCPSAGIRTRSLTAMIVRAIDQTLMEKRSAGRRTR
jgi:hypothetical protein